MFVPMSTSTGEDQHCGSPIFELNQYGVMEMDQLEFFVGVDWSSTDHQVCVVDMEGKVCAQRSFKHCAMGLTEMADWIVRTTQSSPHKVGVAIETPRGSISRAAYSVLYAPCPIPECERQCLRRQHPHVLIRSFLINANPFAPQ